MAPPAQRWLHRNAPAEVGARGIMSAQAATVARRALCAGWRSANCCAGGSGARGPAKVLTHTNSAWQRAGRPAAAQPLGRRRRRRRRRSGQPELAGQPGSAGWPAGGRNRAQGRRHTSSVWPAGGRRALAAGNSWPPALPIVSARRPPARPLARFLLAPFSRSAATNLRAARLEWLPTAQRSPHNGASQPKPAAASSGQSRSQSQSRGRSRKGARPSPLLLAEQT